MLSGYVEGLAELWNVKCRILREETIGFKHGADTFHRHNRKILNARVVGKTGCHENGQ